LLSALSGAEPTLHDGSGVHLAVAALCMPAG